MSNPERYLPLEEPDREALVDFITAGVAVKLTLRDGTLEINVQASHGPGSSTWKEDDFVFELPEREEQEDEDQDLEEIDEAAERDEADGVVLPDHLE